MTGEPIARSLSLFLSLAYATEHLSAGFRMKNELHFNSLRCNSSRATTHLANPRIIRDVRVPDVPDIPVLTR